VQEQYRRSYEIQTGDGISVEIVPALESDDVFWICIEVEDLEEIIRLMFDVKRFSINQLIDILRVSDSK